MSGTTGAATSRVAGSGTHPLSAGAGSGNLDTMFTDVVAIAALVGTGLVAGLFLAFSTAVMPGLARLPAARAAAAMQVVNRAILNPLFGLVFGGTAVLCVVAAATALPDGEPLRLIGAASALAGGYLVTAAVNIPLNNALDRAEPDAAAWERFARPWTRWNHLRTVTTVAATVLLALSVWAG